MVTINPEPYIEEDHIMTTTEGKAVIKTRKRRRLRGLDKYVIFCICLLIIYTIAEFVTSTVTGVEKSTLTLAVFGFFGAPEIIGCALIKIFKIKKGESSE
jgi:uncharacterized membrane protein YobD (UPF0266 family)